MRRIHLLLLITLLGLSSCDLFRLRESMPPSAEARWHDFATTVDMTLENLSFAYMDSRNMINYSTIFTTDFRFYFAPQDETDFSTPASWAAADEQDMLLILHSRVNDIEPVFELTDSADEISASRARLYRSYELTSPQGILAKGNMELHLKKLYGYWYLDKWYDYRLGNERSWGLLKHENS
ncbi:MAG TPA: hypothetical protein GXX77_07135 [Candidatus Cloacimonetes bacterium]|nr:hypothetical protein [Candidatus Cloacimonadota bacterium]